MQRGTDIHKEIEHYLRTGKIRASKYEAYPRVAAQYLPPPMHEDLIVEKRIDLKCVGGVSWIGFIDVAFSGQEPLLLLDTKTTSDFRYAKTKEELRKNTQLMSYAKWVYELGYEGTVRVGHIYLKTYPKKIPARGPQSKDVVIDVSRDEVDEVWEKDMDVVGQMKIASLIEDTNDLPPTVSSCSMYGGCPYRDRCKLSLSDFLNSDPKTEMKGNAMGFLDRLKEDDKSKGNGVVPTGIEPPDAPSRTTPVEAKTEPEPEAKTESAEATTETKPRKKRVKKKTAVEGFTLYIDCMPTKNGDVEPTLFEDWLNPIVIALNETVQEKEGVSDYRLLQYHQPKVAFTIAINGAVDKLPSAMVVRSGTMGADEAVEILIPQATQVVRALR